jgi:hypothetical protein
MAHTQVAIPDSTGALTHILMYVLREMPQMSSFLFVYKSKEIVGKSVLSIVWFYHQVWWLEWDNLAHFGGFVPTIHYDMGLVAIATGFHKHYLGGWAGCRSAGLACRCCRFDVSLGDLYQWLYGRLWWNYFA